MIPSDNLAADALLSGRAGRLHRGQAECVGVWETPGECRLVAIRPIRAGERLFRMEGETTARPTRYSLQVGEELHLDLGPGHSAGEIIDRFSWRFMNHSCEPTVEIRGREVMAMRDIGPTEAVTYNYNTTEWEMAEPFQCRCGSPRCLRVIRGFKHLTSAQRAELPLISPHLVRLAQTALRPSRERPSA